MGIKKYRDDNHEFIEFWWKFHDFWMRGAIKINWEKKNQINWRVEIWSKTFKGAIWSKEPSWVQIEGAKQRRGLFWRWRDFVKGSRKLNAPGSYSLCLIKHYMWGRSMNIMSTRTISPSSLVLLLSLSLGAGPTGTETHSSFSGANYLLAGPSFQQKTNQKWKRTQTATKFYKLYTVGKL
jgi:hypothetical protein